MSKPLMFGKYLMSDGRLVLCITVVAASLTAASPGRLLAQTSVRSGAAALGDWREDAPGVWRHVSVESLPAPFATASARNNSSVAPRPSSAALHTLPGFSVQTFMTGLEGPRLMATAPNGDVFVVESNSGRVRVLRTADGAPKPERTSVYAEGLEQPFGIAFYPAGRDPKWVYVANTNSVVRFAYRNGDLKSQGAPQTVVARLADSEGGHVTRGLVFSPDGRRMFVSVGSQSNVAESMTKKDASEVRTWESAHGRGASWGAEAGRADVLVFTPEGHPEGVYATGIRNCVGLALNPHTHDLWCSTNERDGLGDDLVPDYVTRVREGGFYGWPWYYMGGTQDPRHKGERADLADKVITPDVPVQPHSAALEMTFYPEAQSGPAAFPSEFRGDAFVAFHGSWNRSLRTGYKVVRIKLKDGVPTGDYQDFLTGLVIDDEKVWGRPVGVTVAHDGALLVSEDANGVIWRIAPLGARNAASGASPAR